MREMLALVGFLAGAVVLDQGVGRLLQVVHGRIDGHVANGDVKTQAVANHPDVALMVFGDSRIRGGVNPDVVGAAIGGEAYDAAFDGRGVHFARGLEILRLGRGHRDGCYALSVEVLDVFDPRINRMNPLIPYVGEAPALLDVLAPSDPWVRVKAWSLSWRYNSLLPELARRTLFADRDRSANGFRANEVKWDLTRLPPHSPLGRFADGAPVPDDADPLAVSVLTDFVTDARAAGTQVVWFTTPMHRNEQLHLGDGVLEPVRERARSWLEAEAARQGVPYLSVDEQRYPELQPADLYTDQVHVNARGAEIVSGILGDWLRTACARR